MNFFKDLINNSIDKLGYELKKKNTKEVLYPEFKEFKDIYDCCRPYTMTSQERMFALYKSVEYIIKNNIEGDIVECGVWRGGCPMIAAKTLLLHGNTNKTIWLFDTYEGMTTPTDEDKDLQGDSALKQMHEFVQEKSENWCYASLEDVKRNMISTGYPEDKIKYIKGKVEDVLPGQTYIKNCSLLRLDTDWYESTKIEMEILFPILVKNGILIIDDYGHWQGCKKAVDEYLQQNKIPLLLNRIDYSGRIAVKTQ